MLDADKKPCSGEERLFDYGRSLLYTIYRHASGLGDAEAARLARQAAARRSGAPSAPSGPADTLALRLGRLRREPVLALPS